MYMSKVNESCAVRLKFFAVNWYVGVCEKLSLLKNKIKKMVQRLINLFVFIFIVLLFF